MTKQSFPIPEGCKAVAVEQVGNQIITTFEPQFKRVNPETMQAEEIKKEIPRAKKRDEYYYIRYDNTVCSDVDLCGADDIACYKTGNYFCTREQAQRAADKLKSALDEFWKEELK